jgi:hypothetical protein
MTEAEWLAATDPMPMLEFLRGKVDDRKLRLFAVSCCHPFRNRLTYLESRTALEVAERYADGQATAEDLQQARQRHRDCEAFRTQRNPADAVSAVATVHDDQHGFTSAFMAAVNSAKWSAHAGTDKPDGRVRSYKEPEWRPLWDSARLNQTVIVRCVFGNPFRPVTFDPRWRTADVLGLAKGIYEDPAFDRMPMLADALMDAVCDSNAIIAHCRGDGPHVRGCWVVDLILGRE